MNFNCIGRVGNGAKAKRIGIGLEKLDRSLYDPKKCYAHIGALGAGRVRIQSGWMKTEKQKGVYDFAWLDDIVDNIIEQGASPWMCLCYGNPIYSDEAKKINGAIGVPPVFTQEEKDGWKNYVTAVAEHFKGRVNEYEVWNEPDDGCWRPVPDPVQYGEFVTATASAVKSVCDTNRVFAGSLVRGKLDYLSQMLATGCYKYIDAITYHNYKARHIEDDIVELVADMKALVDTYDSKITIIQGEHGAPSRSDGRGGLSNFSWTEEKQAKFLARKILIDIISGVEFASYFTLADMFENLEGDFVEINEKNYGFFGLLKESFTADGKPSGNYTRKPSFETVRAMCSIFGDDAEMNHAPIRFLYPARASDICQDVDNAYYTSNDFRTVCQSFKKPNGSVGFAYWRATDVINMTYSSIVSIEAYRVSQKVSLVSCLNGEIYEIPKEKIEIREDGRILLKELPIYDYPLILCFGDFV